jgi:hypothetical protein
MITVEQKWQDFRKLVYPGTEESSEQMRQLRACWNSAYLCSITTFEEVCSSQSEVEAQETITSLLKEAAGVVESYVAEEMKRQGLGNSLV